MYFQVFFSTYLIIGDQLIQIKTLTYFIKKQIMDYNNGNQVFQKLKNNIDRLRIERQELNNQMNNDRSDLNNVETAMSQLGKDVDDKMVFVREKQRKLMELEKAINQTEKSYEIIVDTTKKLSNALEAESSHLRGITRK